VIPGGEATTKEVPPLALGLNFWLFILLEGISYWTASFEGLASWSFMVCFLVISVFFFFGLDFSLRWCC
jgi:hypothetical protein